MPQIDSLPDQDDLYASGPNTFDEDDEKYREHTESSADPDDAETRKGEPPTRNAGRRSSPQRTGNVKARAMRKRTRNASTIVPRMTYVTHDEDGQMRLRMSERPDAGVTLPCEVSFTSE